MYRSPLVPAEFEVPETLESDGFRLQQLNYDVLLQDYEAVILGAENLRTAFGLESFDPNTYSMQREVIELGWHMGEWQRRKSFAYANMSRDGSTCYGSVYVLPTLKRDFDAHVVIWVIPDSPKGFDAEVYQAVRCWLTEWPFDRIGYPGREMSWEAWRALPEPKG